MDLRSALASFNDGAMELAVAPSWSRLGFVARNQLEGWNDQPIPRLDGKVVVLTGFTSGIGLAAAIRFGELGATLHLVGRDPGRVATTSEMLRGRGVDVPTGGADRGFNIGDKSRFTARDRKDPGGAQAIALGFLLDGFTV